MLNPLSGLKGLFTNLSGFRTSPQLHLKRCESQGKLHCLLSTNILYTHLVRSAWAWGSQIQYDGRTMVFFWGGGGSGIARGQNPTLFPPHLSTRDAPTITIYLPLCSPPPQYQGCSDHHYLSRANTASLYHSSLHTIPKRQVLALYTSRKLRLMASKSHGKLTCTISLAFCVQNAGTSI